jgi:hypothetical protein
VFTRSQRVKAYQRGELEVMMSHGPGGSEKPENAGPHSDVIAVQRRSRIPFLCRFRPVTTSISGISSIQAEDSSSLLNELSCLLEADPAFRLAKNAGVQQSITLVPEGKSI